MQTKSTVRVFVRLRPVIHQEGQEPEKTCLRAINHNKVELLNWRNIQETLQYSFNQVFAEDSSQEEVFCTCVQPVLTRFIEQRHNVTVFTYGPTGAGKTFTILGTNVQPGIIPRTMRALFSKVRQMSTCEETFSLSMTYLEIYQEKVHDLLRKGNKDLPIRQDSSGRIFVPGLTEESITNFEMFERLFVPASENRTVGVTKLNARSSRSHSILQVKLKCWKTSNPDRHQMAKLFLIDLAGSEDNRRTGNTGVRLKESGSINTSLHVLGKVVDALNAGCTGRIPYRDSKLTRLLQDSLGGSAHTCMIVNVSPELSSIYDTHSTMNFATKSKTIINKPFTCEEKSEKKENSKPKQVLKTPEKKEVDSTQASVPFLSPLIRKHMKQMGSELQDQLNRIEKLVKANNFVEEAEAKNRKDSQPEEKFRLHDLHLDEIRKSSSIIKTLQAQQRAANEDRERKRNFKEGCLIEDFSPLIIKRKKVVSTARTSPQMDSSLRDLGNQRTLLTLEKQKCGDKQEIITIKIPANATETHSMKLLQILNSRDEKLLCTLHGIGSVRARQIVKFHEEHGDFDRIDDLKRVLPKQFVTKFVENSLLHACQFEVA